MMKTIQTIKSYNWVYLAISLVFVSLVIFDGFVLHSPLSRVGDVIEHIAAIDTWLERPFSPENPALNSPASSPRFIPFYFPFILLGSVLGWSAWLTYDVICVLGAVLFLMGLRAFSKTIHPSPLAPIFALIIFTAFWTNPWNFSSVYEFSTLYRIAGYPSILAFSVSLFILANLIKAMKAETISKASWIAVALLTAIVWATHILTGAFLIGAAGLYVLFHRRVALKLRGFLIGAGLFGLALAALWPFYSVWEVALGNGGVGKTSWVTSLNYNAERAPYITKNHAFYQYSRIYPIALGVLCALYCAKKRQFVPLLGIIGFALIYIINIYVRLPLGHRFIIYALFFAHVAITITCLDIWSKWSPALSKGLRFVLAGLAIVLFVSLNYDRIKPHLRPADPDILARNHAIEAVTDESSVIAGSLREIWMLTTYDRKVLALLHPNPLVPDLNQRSVANFVLLTDGSSDDVRELARNCYGVTHLVISTGNKWKQNEDGIKLADNLSKTGLKVTVLPGYAKLVALEPAAKPISCPANAQELMWENLKVVYDLKADL